MYTLLYGINATTDIIFDDLSSRNVQNITPVTTNGGGLYKHKKVLSLCEVSKLKQEEIKKVIICSVFVDEITNSLLSIGVSINQIYFYDFVSSSILKVSNNLVENIDEEDVLYAFYDLSKNMATYDVFTFLINAEMVRIESRRKRIHFVIVPQTSFTSSLSFIQTRPDETLSWRLEHIVRAAFSCLKTTIGVSQLASRDESEYFTSTQKNLFPTGYHFTNRGHAFHFLDLKKYYEKNINLSVIEAPEQAKRIVDMYVNTLTKSKKIIVINLREYEVQPYRNSDLNAWGDFVEQLDHSQYIPVVVRDTYKIIEPLPGKLKNVNVFPLAAMDLSVRIALYESAHITLTVSCGGSHPLHFIKGVACITFMKSAKSEAVGDFKALEKTGRTINENFYLRDNDKQLEVWGDDTLENIVNNFRALEQLILLDKM